MPPQVTGNPIFERTHLFGGGQACAFWYNARGSETRRVYSAARVSKLLDTAQIVGMDRIVRRIGDRGLRAGTEQFPRSPEICREPVFNLGTIEAARTLAL